MLLVYTRRIVGQITYEVCESCASGVITELWVTSPLQDSGLGTRAVAHLRACFPGVTWRSGLEQRLPRDLAHRMRLPDARSGQACAHRTADRRDPAVTSREGGMNGRSFGAPAAVHGT
ncbi:N-acetyltransferase [Streptomyces sp. KL116D]|uniref:N-acetyltransferase n=1 Tax=Streptomyces sp. KL116D TaxID=3045152 RepID=UPI003557309C